VLALAWELPADPVVERAWLAHPPHDRKPPTLTGTDTGHFLRYWEAVYDRPEYLDALNALVAANVLWLRRNPGVPPLYATGVRYLAECCGEVWRHAAAVLARGGGDCEDLSAFRVAQLQLLGVPARIKLQTVGRMGEDLSLHVLVAMPNGQIEDPSDILGATGAGCDPIGPLGRPCPAR